MYHINCITCKPKIECLSMHIKHCMFCKFNKSYQLLYKLKSACYASCMDAYYVSCKLHTKQVKNYMLCNSKIACYASLTYHALQVIDCMLFHHNMLDLPSDHTWTNQCICVEEVDQFQYQQQKYYLHPQQ